MYRFWDRTQLREALVVYTSALLVVLGTLVASRYLVVQRFERIEQRDMAQTLAVLRKSLLAQNTAVETLSRDYARWDDMYSYVTSLDPEFESDNFSQQGLDEANVELVWLLDPQGRIVSTFQNDTAGDRYDHPVRPEMARFLASLTPAIGRITDQQGNLRLLEIDGMLHVVAAHSILHSDRTGPPAGTLVFTRAIRSAEMQEIATAAQSPARLLLAETIQNNVLPDVPQLAIRLLADVEGPGALMLGASEQRMEGATRLSGIDGKALAVIATHRDREVMQNGLRGANYLV
ncbi:MAG TPA: CHASE4 domain-containing protein, partial [Steroidobacteraceae bacterium]|nr:CHASE4 domain-containing protein [Steroidobacteraceae bacterium]